MRSLVGRDRGVGNMVPGAPQDPGDGGDRGSGGAVAQAVRDETVANLPTELARVLALVLVYLALHLRSGDSRLGSTNDARPDGACFLVAVEDFGDAAMADSQLTGYDAGPDSSCRHFNDLEAYVIWQGSAVYEHSPKLVNSALACKSHFDGHHLYFYWTRARSLALAIFPFINKHAPSHPIKIQLP